MFSISKFSKFDENISKQNAEAAERSETWGADLLI